MFNKPPPQTKKGRELETMPYFLSDEFKLIMEEKHKKEEQMKQLAAL